MAKYDVWINYGWKYILFQRISGDHTRGKGKRIHFLLVKSMYTFAVEQIKYFSVYLFMVLSKLLNIGSTLEMNVRWSCKVVKKRFRTHLISLWISQWGRTFEKVLFLYIICRIFWRCFNEECIIYCELEFSAGFCTIKQSP